MKNFLKMIDRKVPLIYFFLSLIEMILLLFYIYDGTKIVIYLTILNLIFIYLWGVSQYKIKIDKNKINIISSIMNDVDQINIYIVDLQMNYLALSKSGIKFMQHYFNATPKVGQNISTILSHENYLETRKNFLNAIYHGLTSQVDHFKEGELEFHTLNFYTPLYDKKQKPYALLIHTIDISDDIIQQQKSYKLIYTDPLTGLYNRRKLTEYFEEVVKKSEKEKEFAFLLLDLDDFKQVNDQLGHISGDKLIINFSSLLTKYFSETGIICRMGGDEFCLITDYTDTGNDVFLKKIEMLESEFFPNKISYGTVKISHPITEGFDHFYKEADSKMYQMKSNNKEVANNPKQKKHS